MVHAPAYVNVTVLSVGAENVVAFATTNEVAEPPEFILLNVVFPVVRVIVHVELPFNEPIVAVAPVPPETVPPVVTAKEYPLAPPVPVAESIPAFISSVPVTFSALVVVRFALVAPSHEVKEPAVTFSVVQLRANVLPEW